MEAHGHVTAASTGPAADVEEPDVSDGGAPETDVIDQEPASRGHASESYFILDEGLLTESAAGAARRPAGEPPRRPRRAPPFRFRAWAQGRRARGRGVRRQVARR